MRIFFEIEFKKYSKRVRESSHHLCDLPHIHSRKAQPHRAQKTAHRNEG